MLNYKRKPRKTSVIEIIDKYAHNPEACVDFFFNIKWPSGFYCEKCNCTHYYFIKERNVFKCAECHHQHYLFANTIFQDKKLPLFKLIFGLFLFFTANKGCSAIEMASQLDSLFYEADTLYVGAKTSNKPGMATEQQPVLMVLSTRKENQYPEYVKLAVIPKDNKYFMEKFISMKVKLTKDRTLNTDGKTTFNGLKEKVNLKSAKIVYTDPGHRLQRLNTIAGGIKNNIAIIYHGVPKRSLPPFLHEQE